MDGFADVLEAEVTIAHADQELLQQLVLEHRLVVRVIVPHAGGQAFKDGAWIFPFAYNVEQQRDEGTAEEAVWLVSSPLGHHATVRFTRFVFIFKLHNLLVGVGRDWRGHLTGRDGLQEPEDARAVEGH